MAILEADFQRIKEYIGRFVSVTETEWQPFRDALVKKQVAKGSYLIEAGEVCDYVAFINKGLFRTICIVDKKEVTFNFWFDGNFITDYSSFLTRTPTIEFHQALEDAEVMMLSHAKIQDIYANVPAWEKFGRLIAEFILVRIMERNRAMLFLNAEEQYLNLMKTRPKVIASIPQRYIASYLGIQPESLSRIRKKLSESKKAS
jgi:CRP/FNR family transcriptional regulator, anaerobic regulatory protein